jgi:hypothetical protein
MVEGGAVGVGEGVTLAVAVWLGVDDGVGVAVLAAGLKVLTGTEAGGVQEAVDVGAGLLVVLGVELGVALGVELGVRVELANVGETSATPAGVGLVPHPASSVTSKRQQATVSQKREAS